ncbi:MAG: lipopolysaccharide assembly protein LapA domain-containing protein [Pseudomonadota bacterium]
MIYLRRLLYLVILLLALACMLVLGLLGQNQAQVSLRLLEYQTPEYSVFWWLLAAFGAGLSLGLLLLLISNLKHLFEQRAVVKEVKQRDKEIAVLQDERDQLKVERLRSSSEAEPPPPAAS